MPSAAELDDRHLATVLEGKSAAEEKFLEQLNDALAATRFDDAGECNFDKPIIYVVGAPRSGTTLAYQILAASLPFGYVTNIAAQFWRKPSVGLRLSRILLGDQAYKMIAFQSSLGMSQGVAGPHEFGYFWNYWFRYDLAKSNHLDDQELSRVDLDSLQATLRQEILAYVGDGFIFKNLTCGFQARTLARLHPKSLFCHVVRDEYCTAASILSWRKHYHGSYHAWFSLKPSSYPLGHLVGDPPLQVLEQVRSTRRELDEIFLNSNVHSLTLPYERICCDPAGFVRLVCERLGSMDCEVTPRKIEIPEFRAGSALALPDEYESRLREFCRPNSVTPTE